MIARGVNNAITRRTFAKLAASGLIAWALGLDSPRKLRVGIGAYTYHSLTLDAMIAQLKLLKISEIEMSRGEFMLMNHPGGDVFQAARRELDQAGIRCVSYYSATIKNDQDLENAVRFAKILGVRNI
jgi:hypothetical protein